MQARTNLAICAEHKKRPHAHLAALGFLVDGNTIYATVAEEHCQVCKSMGKEPVVMEGEVMDGSNRIKAKNVNEPVGVERRKKGKGRDVPPAVDDAIRQAKARIKDAGSRYSLLIDIALTDERGQPVERHIKVYQAKVETARGTFAMVTKALDEAGRNMEKKDGGTTS